MKKLKVQRLSLTRRNLNIRNLYNLVTDITNRRCNHRKLTLKFCNINVAMEIVYWHEVLFLINIFTHCFLFPCQTSLTTSSYLVSEGKSKKIQSVFYRSKITITILTVGKCFQFLLFVSTYFVICASHSKSTPLNWNTKYMEFFSNYPVVETCMN